MLMLAPECEAQYTSSYGIDEAREGAEARAQGHYDGAPGSRGPRGAQRVVRVDRSSRIRGDQACDPRKRSITDTTIENGRAATRKDDGAPGGVTSMSTVAETPDTLDAARARALAEVRERFPDATPQIEIFDAATAPGFIIPPDGRKIVAFEIVGDSIIVATISRTEHEAARALRGAA